jgi:hypothetical protein
VLAEYVEYLESAQIVKSSTVLGHLDTFTHFFKWFCFHSIAAKELRWCLDPMQDIIAKCRGRVSKMLRKEKSDNTLSTKVERKHLPRDGFATLNDIITTKLKWIDSMMNVRPENVTKALYDSVISIIISGHYCRLPTGRPRAFSFLRLDQMDDFRGKGLAVSEFFKTNTKFGLI